MIRRLRDTFFRLNSPSRPTLEDALEVAFRPEHLKGAMPRVLHLEEISLNFSSSPCAILVKGPLKYLLMPLLGKNQLAITLHMYASIGPNLDNTHRGQI